MTISYTTDRMFACDPQEAIANPCNTDGVAGAGLSLEFRRRFPDNFRAYQIACSRGLLVCGRVMIFDRCSLAHAKIRTESDKLQGECRSHKPRWIVNLPTKRHWWKPSTLEIIEMSLAALISECARLQIQAIDLPALGCGLGGLHWHNVKSTIERCLTPSNLNVRVHLP